MHLIQLLLPLYDGDDKPLPKNIFEEVSIYLTEKYGGLTSFVRSPAIGLWKEMEHKTVRDDIVIYEVMVRIWIQPGGILISSNYAPFLGNKKW